MAGFRYWSVLVHHFVLHFAAVVMSNEAHSVPYRSAQHAEGGLLRSCACIGSLCLAGVSFSFSSLLCFALLPTAS
jgi:hypothetical protein